MTTTEQKNGKSCVTVVARDVILDTIKQKNCNRGMAMVAKHVTLNTTEQKNGNRGMAMVARCVILEAEMKFMKQSGCFLQKLTTDPTVLEMQVKGLSF